MMLQPERQGYRQTDMARPTKCTKAVVDEVCPRLANGESLRSVCSDEAVPAMSSILLWVVEGRLVEGTEQPFSEHYMRARQAGGFAHADRVIEVVDKVATAEYEPSQAKAMLDGLKWAAERMASKHHSARQEVDHSSSDGSMTPKVIERRVVDPKAENE